MAVRIVIQNLICRKSNISKYLKDIWMWYYNDIKDVILQVYLSFLDAAQNLRESSKKKKLLYK